MWQSHLISHSFPVLVSRSLQVSLLASQPTELAAGGEPCAKPAISHDSNHVSLVQLTNLCASRHKGHRFKSPGWFLCETGILLLAMSRYNVVRKATNRRCPRRWLVCSPPSDEGTTIVPWAFSAASCTAYNWNLSLLWYMSAGGTTDITANSLNRSLFWRQKGLHWLLCWSSPHEVNVNRGICFLRGRGRLCPASRQSFFPKMPHIAIH
jgi:hypothetical protein